MNTRIKNREIQFDPMPPDTNPAQTALLLLAELAGIEKSLVQNRCLLLISYDVAQITLDDILTELNNHGLHLYNSLLVKLKQALFSYTEQTQRANLGISQKTSARDVFMNQYKRRPHGCRDQRPQHWRHYL